MTIDLQCAVSSLTEDVTSVLVKEDMIFCSRERGIKPLMTWIKDGQDLHGFSVADRIVGKAAALLFVYVGIQEVHAAVLSEPGKQVLERYGIPYSFDTLTDRIINRDRTGLCPMETAVLDTDDPHRAFSILAAKVKE